MTTFDILIAVIQTPSNWIVLGLSSFLGKVWARRISQTEEAKIKKELAKIQSDLARENDVFSKSLQHQNELIQHALQGATTEKEFVFQKQYEAIMDLWAVHLKIKSESARFFSVHSILNPNERNNPEIFLKKFLLTEDQIFTKIENIMSEQDKVLIKKPIIPQPIFNLYSALNTFYARLGLNIVFERKKSGKVLDWYGDKSAPDYSVLQLIDIAKQLNIQLPPLAEDGKSFDLWKGRLEEALIVNIQKFMQGSLDRQLEMHQQLKLVTEAELQTAKENS